GRRQRGAALVAKARALGVVLVAPGATRTGRNPVHGGSWTVRPVWVHFVAGDIIASLAATVEHFRDAHVPCAACRLALHLQKVLRSNPRIVGWHRERGAAQCTRLPLHA